MNTPQSPSVLRSFRIVADPALEPSVRALLESEGFRFEPEPFSPLCWRLTCEPFPLGSSLAAFFGYVYIQDRSSMLPPLALAPEEGATVVDMCSSPGSKTGLLAQLVGRTGFVLANELSHSRLSTLRMTLQTCNAVQVGTCSYSGDRLPLRPGSCRYIMLDPPCSGWGTVEKNPHVMDVWRESKVKPLIQLQQSLLARAAELLAPGGTVVYSTCTTNSDENERQVEFAERELGLVRDPVTPFPGFYWDDRTGSEGTLRVDGEKSRAQGFYVARLRKPSCAVCPDSADAEGGSGLSFWGGGSVSRAALASATLDPALLPAGCCGVFSGTVRFLPEAAMAFLPEKFVWQGAPLGRLSGGGFQADARLRVFMRPNALSLVLESVAEVRALLSGAARKCALSGKEAGLWLGDLPLGRVSLRQGRVIAGFGR
ncbi:MAG: RsmB/NOP family class I SAM-dependent RNA methyltransferase [Desulfovibrionaceae bacterium]|nr:RsmB/NOP family class I SAM-dependent RNA methyltransferase [Desulfovibrionaceae bacterium]